MLNIQYDIKRRKVLKDILLRLRHEESEQSMKNEVDRYVEDVGIVGLLLVKQALLNNDDEVTIEDAKRFSAAYPQFMESTISDAIHPVNTLKRENRAFQSVMDEIAHLLKLLADEPEEAVHLVEEVQRLIASLGSFHQHYHRKEKLLFPIMERHGHYRPTRIMWEEDDRIRALYQGIKRRVEQLPDGEIAQTQKRFDVFKQTFENMIYEEEAILLPILLDVFKEEDWAAVAKESEAYGYAMIDVEEVWKPSTDLPKSKVTKNEEQKYYRFGNSYLTVEDANVILLNLMKASRGEDWAEIVKESEVFGYAMINAEETWGSSTANLEIGEKKGEEHFQLGGGYLTLKEANHILNNLPLEITFVDKNSIFKYFNEMTEASEMMLVRTPISIGRNVANCHPPKSLRKVMSLIRDLIARKRTSESMWFKRNGQYIHITYKALFDDKGAYLGILEYVQDIQPFFELPEEIKMGLSPIE